MAKSESKSSKTETKVETPAKEQAKEQPKEQPRSDVDVAAIALALAAPFESTEIKFKPQTVSGNRALAVPFVDARVIQDRLDDVLGVMGWQDSYECLPDGSVVCRLKIRLGDEWIVKEDVGGQSEQPDEGDRRKAAFSDALKRAAVKFGIGRYLYRQKPTWVDYDPQKRQFVRQPVLVPMPEQAKAEPRLVVKPMPQPAPKPEENEASKAPSGQDFHRRLQEYDAKLAEQGLCKAGDLVKHVAAAGKKAGFAADMTTWAETEIKLAREQTKAFETSRREATLKQVA
jgi:hypothetical protein